MKKVSILFLLTLITGSLFLSCSKDDSGPVNLSFLEGKWNFNRSTASSSGFTIPYSTEYVKNEDGCSKDYIEFISGGTVKFGDYKTDCAFVEKTGTWKQSENTVVISVSGSNLNGTFKIDNLSTTNLLLKIDGNYNGKSGTFNLYFTK